VSLFESLDVSAWVRASEARTKALARFDQGAELLGSAVKRRGERGIPAPTSAIAVSPAMVAFHGPDGAEELAGEVGVSADAWAPANDALKQAVASREGAERALATALAQQQKRVRLLLAAIVLLLLYLGVP
jgi:hypothetical protein